MTTGKPSGDGHIINFSWDNTGGWDSQLAILTGKYPKIDLRGMDSGTWQTWRHIESRTELYNNTSGTTGTITLNDSAANFNYITIHYRNNDNRYSSTTIYRPTAGANPVALWCPFIYQDIGKLYIKVKEVKLSGTSITVVKGVDVLGDFNYDANNDVISIIRVDGYK